MPTRGLASVAHAVPRLPDDHCDVLSYVGTARAACLSAAGGELNPYHDGGRSV